MSRPPNVCSPPIRLQPTTVDATQVQATKAAKADQLINVHLDAAVENGGQPSLTAKYLISATSLRLGVTAFPEAAKLIWLVDLACVSYFLVAESCQSK